MLGGERSLLATRAVIERAGIELVALCPAGGPLPEALKRQGIACHAFDCRDPSGARRPQAVLRGILRDALGKLGVDLLHANSLSMGRLSGPVAADLGLPSVAHLRDILRLSRTAVDDLGRHRRLLAVSRATRSYHVAQGLPGEGVYVLYNGVDLQRWRPRDATGWLHRELKLPQEARLIGAIGQLIQRKGQDVLAAAACHVSERQDLHYVIVGERYSRKAEAIEYVDRVRNTFRRGGLAGRVHFLGHRDDVERILPEVVMLVHAARQEPLGRVLLESAASGLPVVASDVGGTREIFPAADSGAILVPDADPLAVADAIAELADNTALRRQMGADARRRAESRFALCEASNGLLGHYQEVLEFGRRRSG